MLAVCIDLLQVFQVAFVLSEVGACVRNRKNTVIIAVLLPSANYLAMQRRFFHSPSRSTRPDTNILLINTAILVSNARDEVCKSSSSDHRMPIPFAFQGWVIAQVVHLLANRVGCSLRSGLGNPRKSGRAA